MKKITAVVMAAILLVMLLPDLPSEAVTYYPIGSALYLDAAWTGNANGIYTIYCQNDNSRYPYVNNSGLYVKTGYNGSLGYQCYWYDPINNMYRPFAIGDNYCSLAYIEDAQFTGSITLTSNYGHCYCYSDQNDFNEELPPDYRPEDPSWWNEMWNTLYDELGNPAFWFGQWFIDIIDNVFGGEDDPTGPPKPPTSTHVQINNPSITPAPTPIPYTTVVIPKTDPVSGDTYYEENYYYINPSGTPIITSSPPTNTPSQNGSGNDTDYSPVGGDPYSIPQVSWLTNATIGDSNYDGILSISQGMDSIDEIGSEYVDGMGAVQDATGTLPTSWLLLIGIAAAIPLIAGIISRFLS